MDQQTRCKILGYIFLKCKFVQVTLRKVKCLFKQKIAEHFYFNDSSTNCIALAIPYISFIVITVLSKSAWFYHSTAAFYKKENDAGNKEYCRY